MQMPFRSSLSATLFCILTGMSLFVPILLPLRGMPSLQQAFVGSPDRAGFVASTAHTIFTEKGDADVLFVGASLVQYGVLPKLIERSLTIKLGRPVRVRTLALNWYGSDLQYLMLREYVARHHARVVVLNPPEPYVFGSKPHAQAYRWMRFGETTIAAMTVPPLSKIQMFANMVVGAPRQLLAMVRPNMVDEDELTRVQWSGDKLAAALADKALTETPPPAGHIYSAASSALTIDQPKVLGLHVGLGQYTLYYLKQINRLLHSAHSSLYLLEIPTNKDFGSSRIKQLYNWREIFGENVKTISVPSAELFANLDPKEYYMSGDAHMNAKGAARFTTAISAPIVAAVRGTKN